MKVFNFLIDGPINVFTIDVNAESEEEAYNEINKLYGNRYDYDILECVCTSEPGFDRDEFENGRFYRYGEEY
jgi:hypothetical protein